MTSRYYRIARESSLHIGNHPGLVYLQGLCHQADTVLDVGCGEGSRLNTLLPAKSGTGIDPSRQALGLARRRYPRHKFLRAAGELLPFADNSFDLVYSAFAIEHCQSPMAFISEMIRVCRPGGHLVILSPNYGAPSRRSPVSVQNPIAKLLSGIITDLVPFSGLNWRSVTPKQTYQHIDDDTTFEPYLLSLIRFLKTCPVTIEKSSSLWDIEPKPKKLYRKFFRAFKYWGPQIFVCACKINSYAPVD